MSSHSSVGSYLRELRLRGGVSLEEVSRSTRIPTRYLEALESEQFSSLPAPVFIRGFIRAYCQAIGHPAEEALAFYHPDGEPETPHARPAPRSPARPGRARGAVAVSLTLVVVLGVALFGVTRFLQYGRDAGAQVTASRSVDAPARTAVSPPLVTTTAMEEAVSPPATSALPATVSSATPAPAPRAPEVTTPAAPAPVASSQPAQPPASSSVSVAAAPPRSADSARPGRDGGPIVGAVTSPYRLVARASETTWVKVRMDDGRSTEETIPAGETREWISNSPFVLTVGNAGGVSLELNGERLPPLGAKGVVVQRLVIPPQSQQ